MTWGRKNGDAGNCAGYPPVCTYEGMQQRLRESYLEMSDDNDATCSPVGVAWRTFRNQFPAIELYNPDESHPSVNGTYLAACVFYSTLYQKACSGAAYVFAGVAAADATNMQNIAGSTVLDSIENWQQYGHLPKAAFSHSVNQNVVSFTNASLRAATYEWDFGDGSPLSNAVNPSHTYAAIGNYTVKLTARSACNKYTLKTAQISIASIPNAIDDVSDDNDKGLRISYVDQKLFISGSYQEMIVIDLYGRRVLYDQNETGRNFVGCAYLPSGVYFYKALSKQKKTVMGKFIVE
jgi:hypothetical protein